MLKKIKPKKTPSIVIDDKELKIWSRKIEVKYWTETGIKKGTVIYDKYWESFDMDEYDFSGKKILEVGCGPFGGVFYSHPEFDVSLVDFCSKEYNEMGYSKREIEYGNLSHQLPFGNNIFDYAICTNTIDHTLDVKKSLNELFRVLKMNGMLFLHVHLRTREELSNGHIHVLSSEIMKQYVREIGFVDREWEQKEDWVNEDERRPSLFLVLEKLL
jgi:ubiquinone/menaquinone biosynthesis C-methylase UbiE